MTSGKIAVITPEGKLLTSLEFNGEMDYKDFGRDIYEELEYIETVEEFKEFVIKFNKDNFSYQEDLFCVLSYTCFDMENDYLNKSDYVYIKNLAEKPIALIDASGKRLQLDTDTIAVFNYGEFVAATAKDFDTAAVINELGELKENLSYDMAENYTDIWNMCADYDGNHHSSYLTDRIQEFDFLDTEVLDYLVKDTASDLSRLKCFVGKTYDAEIYKLDGYGNLANVEDSDFEDLIDDLVSNLKQSISIPTAKKEMCL